MKPKDISPCQDNVTSIHSPKVHPALKEYFGYCLYKSAMQYRARMNEFLSRFGLCSPQFAMLRVLKHLGPITQIEFCKQMDIDKASMVKFIDGLEAEKLVIRVGSREDRRVKFIQITKEGLARFEELLEAVKEVEKDFLEPLTPEERKQLGQIIPKLLRF